MIRPHTGDALLERYRLGRQGWKTESGMTYDGVAIATGKPVVIEIAHDLDQNARERFERDSMIAEQLEDGHALHVYEAGALVDGTPWIVREPTLGTVETDIDARGPLPTAEAVAITLEVCEALAEAHSKGMAHGDVRPSNVHVVTDSAGIPFAKLRWIGSAGADVSSDIAGAARLLRYLVTGEHDLEAEGVKTLPSDLALAVARALSKQGAPYENIGEFANAIAAYAPAGHSSARNIHNLLARGLARELAGGAVMRRQQEQPGVNDEWFESRASFPNYPPPPPRRRAGGGVFAAVAALLVGGTLAGTMFLWSTGQLPQWTGTGPTMDQGSMSEVEVPTMTDEQVADTTCMSAPEAVLAPKDDEIGPLEKSGTTATQSPMYDVDEEGNPVSNTSTTGADITPSPKPVPSAAKPTSPPDMTSRPQRSSPTPSPTKDDDTGNSTTPSPSTDDTAPAEPVQPTTPKPETDPGF